MRVLLVFLLAAVIVVTGCEKSDLTVAGDEALVTERAAHTVPLKCAFHTIPNEEQEMGAPNGWLAGHATHMGNLQWESSPYWYTAPPEFSGNPDYPLRVFIFNFLAAANGDISSWAGHLDVNPETGMFIGHLDLVPHEMNSGRFEGATGYANISEDDPGFTDPETGVGTWDAAGEITFP